MLTVLVHGFWGGPQDWNEVIKALPLGLEVWTPDLYEPGPLAPHHTLEEWTGHFLEELEDRAHGRPVNVVGYSMGGRLVTEALIKNKNLNMTALILSANPLNLSESEKSEREVWEMSWRNRFLNEDWEALEAAWNSQELFDGQKSWPRRRFSILREMLGQSLVHWSPRGHGERERLKALSQATTWAFGALDQKYLKVAKDLAKVPVQGQINVIENASHRLPLDAAPWIQNWIVRSSL